MHFLVSSNIYYGNFWKNQENNISNNSFYIKPREQSLKSKILFPGLIFSVNILVFSYIFFLKKVGTSRSSPAGADGEVWDGITLESFTDLLPNGLIDGDSVVFLWSWNVAFDTSSNQVAQTVIFN
jgi:hypothetical protein